MKETMKSACKMTLKAHKQLWSTVGNYLEKEHAKEVEKKRKIEKLNRDSRNVVAPLGEEVVRVFSKYPCPLGLTPLTNGFSLLHEGYKIRENDVCFGYEWKKSAWGHFSIPEMWYIDSTLKKMWIQHIKAINNHLSHANYAQLCREYRFIKNGAYILGVEQDEGAIHVFICIPYHR